MTQKLNEPVIRVGQPLPGSGLFANRERGRVGRVRRENTPPDGFLILLTAPERYQSCPQPKVQAHHRQRPHVQHRAEALAARLHREWAEPEVALRRCKHRLPANGQATPPMSGRAKDGSISL